MNISSFPSFLFILLLAFSSLAVAQLDGEFLEEEFFDAEMIQEDFATELIQEDFATEVIQEEAEEIILEETEESLFMRELLQKEPEQDLFDILIDNYQDKSKDEDISVNVKRKGFETITGDFVHRNDYHYFIVAYNQANIAEAQELIQKKFIVEGYLPEHRYVVYTSVKKIENFIKKGVIAFYEPYTTYENIVSEYVFTEEAFEDIYMIGLFSSADEQAIAEQLLALGVDVLEVYDSVLLVRLADPLLVEDFVGIEGIQFVEPRRAVALFNDKSNVVSGVAGKGGVRETFGLYGKGQIIAITDSGLDTGKNDKSMHDDFEGRILKIIDVPWLRGTCKPPTCISAKGLDWSSHGTHVSGSALGNGVKSGSDVKNHKYDTSFAGSAPEAKLVFLSGGLFNTKSQKYFFIPNFPEKVTQWGPAKQLGVRIHSNSFGVPNSLGKYSSWPRNLDDFSNKNKDYLLLFAAGNAHVSKVGTVAIPSTAKNSISVGGVWRDKPSTQVYARGPTADGRFKPDIVAPAIGFIGQTSGKGIISTKSSKQLAFPIGCRGGPGGNLNTFYCELSGTSMATPHVAGMVALIREYYQTKRNTAKPSASLLKATLLNGGEDMGKGIPHVDYGWGRANLAKSLPKNPDDLVFFDEVQGLKTNEKKVYKIFADATKPLRVTLVWTDQPSLSWSNQQSPRLINDLNLVVTDPNNKQYNGNDITVPYNNQKDKLNNVERVEIKNPVKGMYTVEVSGFNVPLGPQDFSLVASRASIDPTITIKGTPQVAKPFTFEINDPSHPGELLFLMLSFTGTTPGIPVGKRVIPGNYDVLSELGFLLPAAIGLKNPVLLDSNGKASITWNVPPIPFLSVLSFSATCFSYNIKDPLPYAVKGICTKPVLFKIQP